jgi:hypothetical protein
MKNIKIKIKDQKPFSTCNPNAYAAKVKAARMHGHLSNGGFVAYPNKEYR